MDKRHLTYIIVFICSLTSCFHKPDMKMLNTDLGITIPKKHKIIKYDSDPFGPPGDQEITYIFSFDSLSYNELVANIEASKCYNTASGDKFEKMPIDQKLRTLKVLSQNKMTAFWIKTDSSYEYDGSKLFLNHGQPIIEKAALNNIFLQNYDSTDFGIDGYSPRRIYSVLATVDIKKHTLFYNYVHP